MIKEKPPKAIQSKPDKSTCKMALLRLKKDLVAYE